MKLEEKTLPCVFIMMVTQMTTELVYFGLLAQAFWHVVMKNIRFRIKTECNGIMLFIASLLELVHAQFPLGLKQGH